MSMILISLRANMTTHTQSVSTLSVLEVYTWLSVQEIIYYSTVKRVVSPQLLAVSAFRIHLSFWIIAMYFWGCSQKMSDIVG